MTRAHRRAYALSTGNENRSRLPTAAPSRGDDKEELARQLGAHEYVDTKVVSTAEALQKLGGADLILATASSTDAIAGAVEGLKPRGKLRSVAAAAEPVAISTLNLLSGRSIAGWPSGSAIDSEDTMRFSTLSGIKPRIEKFSLEDAEQAFARMMSNQVRLRAVLVP